MTVDPDGRYNIKQFLNHPWIRESQEETYAAADAPPLANPLQRDPQLQYLDETTGGERRMDFRSPGAVNLREIFDVGYAVHRQEEEVKRRKNFAQGYRGANAIKNLNALDEEDDDYDDDESAPMDPSKQHPPAKLPKNQAADVSTVEKQMRNTSLGAAAQARQANVPKSQGYQARGYGQHSPEIEFFEVLLQSIRRQGDRFATMALSN